ncbi:unnamed protein product [Oppiella nova]|uniref:ATP-dependent RecD-like DNA helicase n=1 Tax=Oppiella nova TaxID=334625 RepID=A0A7R9QB29_9ACAR|nr:unnamed protein product [Oppiella nova]CAG2162350.1 unnamed protein product [Oppiella nova]
MKTNDNKEFISGIVERVTFHNPENGFCVLRAQVKGHKDLVTIVGNTPSASVGEYIQCSGNWHNDKNHGLQFKAAFLKAMPPNTLEGIEKYLGSGLIKGIGPHFAKKLVTAFCEQVFEVIENQSHLLATVEGIGKIRAATICNNWQEQKIIREIMVFLQSHGVGTTRATRIYKTYGDKSIEMVSENPYRLAKDIQSIGFISADKIAANLGIQKNSLIRARAGVNYILLEATSNGNCGLPTQAMLQSSTKLLEIEESIVQTAIEEEIKLGSLTRDSLNSIETIFLTSYYLYEKHIARILLSLSKGIVAWKQINTSNAIPWVENKLTIQLADTQKIAVEQALQNKVMVITGGPGTGKTTLVNSILSILKAKQLCIKLCAPTGRAAKRLSEIGAGQVLKDIIDSNTIPTVRLTEIFRQAKTSNIITNAHLVNQGLLPNLKYIDKESDFYFINAEPGVDIIQKIVNLVRDRIPNDIQVLSPMQRGGTGVRSLNIELQKALNPNHTFGIEKYGQIFAVNDKVMQTENDYDKEVYNGDIGIIRSINQENQEVVISFYNREVRYDYTDLDQITLAYATTIHKSQGSEYPVVVIPLTMQSFTMLKRNLVYTAITRGKNLVIIIGQKKALAIAVKDNKGLMRYTKLQEWLCNDKNDIWQLS